MPHYYSPQATLVGRTIALSQILTSILISFFSVNSLKCASFASFSTWSMIKSNLTAISTSKEAKAAKGRASENSKLSIAILLRVGFNVLLSEWCSLFDRKSSNAETSVFTEGKAVVLYDECWLVWAASMVDLAWAFLVPRKRRGWDLMDEFKACKASWRLSERMSGGQCCRFLMLIASSRRILDTSPATLQHGSRNNDRTDCGVCV